MTKSQVIGRALTGTACVYCVVCFVLCIGVCAGCLECLRAPPRPTSHTPADGPSFDDLIKGFEAFKTLLKVIYVASFVIMKGLYPSDRTWEHLQEAITAFDRSFGATNK